MKNTGNMFWLITQTVLVGNKKTKIKLDLKTIPLTFSYFFKLLVMPKLTVIIAAKLILT